MADVLIHKVIKSRKEHLCWGCCTEFKSGSLLRYTKSVDAGDFMQTYMCRPCDVTAEQHYDESDDGFGFGLIRELDGWAENVASLPRTFDEITK